MYIIIERRVWRYQREVIRIRKSKKHRQHNDKNKKDKQRSTKHTHKTKDRVTRIRNPLITSIELRCSRRICINISFWHQLNFRIVPYWNTHTHTHTHTHTPLLAWPLRNIGVTNDHGYIPLDVSTSRSFPHSWLITGFTTILTRRVSLVEQQLLTLPENLSSPRF